MLTGILRRKSTPAACERVRSKELLSAERSHSPATIKYVERSPPPPMSSPGHSPGIKSRQARKAVRRAYSSQESGGRPERKPPDARSPRRPPPLELSLQGGIKDTGARGSIQSPLSPDVSSLSSYKETSPECEISPPQTASQDSNIPPGADFRTRTRTPTGRGSLESRLRKRPGAVRSGPKSPYRTQSAELRDQAQQRVTDDSPPPPQSLPTTTKAMQDDSSTRSQTPSRTSSNVSKSTFYTPETSRKASSDIGSEPGAAAGATADRGSGSAPGSQQSSVVGIDWLFDADTDSSSGVAYK